MAKLLLITQDGVLTKAYRVRLAKAGFEVDDRCTGHEGLVRARQWTPDLIVLDLTLPGMHGLDVLKSLRDVPWLVKVPVVLLVERTVGREILDECALWGADRCLQKDVCSLQEQVTQLQAVLRARPVNRSTSTS